jgi:hypothetical protein
VHCGSHLIFETHLVTKKQTRKRFRHSILEAWKWKCAYCGKDIAKSATLDHVIPRSQGGQTVRENLIACCPECNVSKSDQNVWDWYRSQPFYSLSREALIWEWLYDSPSTEKEHRLFREYFRVI